MKKGILAISAAAAIGGLGFSSAAHAVYYFGDSEEASFDGLVLGNIWGTSHRTQAANAVGVMLNEGGIGNYLFTPYFTTQGDNNTLVSVVNNDAVNGKIVKVRFRGAANSEDLLDFQVFLSPSDVWTASLTQGTDGRTVITAPDKSCTLPSLGTASEAERTFKTSRLVATYPTALGPVATTPAQLTAQTREGYIEYLNMADVVPGSPLFGAIKHVNGVAPCTPGMMALLSSTAEGSAGNAVSTSNVNALGMSASSGGLSGTWSIFSNRQTKAFGDNHVAVEAVDRAGNPARGRISYSPQLASSITASGADSSIIFDGTADPVLRASPNDVMWNDLPDMSTPVERGNTAPLNSINQLSATLSKDTVNNEFVATAGAGAVPWDTDWVVAHATRRYNATLDANGGIAERPGNRFFSTNPVTGNLSPRVTAGGYMLCQSGTMIGYDREEGTAGVAFSPSSQFPFCGEVNTISFNRASVALNASVTNQVVTLTTAPNNAPIQAGWASLELRKNGRRGAIGAPVVGYAATSAVNTTSNGNFGYNNRHRWTRPVPNREGIPVGG